MHIKKHESREGLTMSQLGPVGVALSVVFALFMTVLFVELYYVWWSRQRRLQAGEARNRLSDEQSAAAKKRVHIWKWNAWRESMSVCIAGCSWPCVLGSAEDVFKRSAKLLLMWWRPPASKTKLMTGSDAQELELEGGGKTGKLQQQQEEAIIKLDQLFEDEDGEDLLKMGGLMWGPPRLLFTITEETKEEMEQQLGAAAGGAEAEGPSSSSSSSSSCSSRVILRWSRSGRMNCGASSSSSALIDEDPPPQLGLSSMPMDDHHHHHTNITGDVLVQLASTAPPISSSCCCTPPFNTPPSSPPFATPLGSPSCAPPPHNYCMCTASDHQSCNFHVLRNDEAGVQVETYSMCCTLQASNCTSTSTSCSSPPQTGGRRQLSSLSEDTSSSSSPSSLSPPSCASCCSSLQLAAASSSSTTAATYSPPAELSPALYYNYSGPHNIHVPNTMRTRERHGLCALLPAAPPSSTATPLTSSPALIYPASYQYNIRVHPLSSTATIHGANGTSKQGNDLICPSSALPGALINTNLHSEPAPQLLLRPPSPFHLPAPSQPTTPCPFRPSLHVKHEAGSPTAVIMRSHFPNRRV